MSSHRAGPLKQNNKRHKSGGASSKRSKVNKFGRVEEGSGKRANVKGLDPTRGKDDRVNFSKQKAQAKREALIAGNTVILRIMCHGLYVVCC